MLRPGQQPWWRRIFAEATVVSDAAAARRCPDCSSAYDSRDRYCPRCHTATPEWRYG